MYGANAQRVTEQEMLRIEASLLGDASIWQQYIMWMTNFIHGDWGFSFLQQQAVFLLLKEQGIYTLVMVIMALLLTNIMVTIITLMKPHVQKWLNSLLLLTMILPSFWFSFLLFWLFTVKWDVLPSYLLSMQWFDVFVYLLLPSTVLALPAVYYGMQLLRDQQQTLQQQPFMQRQMTRRMQWKHQFPHISLAYLQLNGQLVPAFIGGTLAIEMVFSIPGIGKLTVESTKMHDYTTLLAIILLMLAIVLVVQLVIDVMSCWIDPRVHKSLGE